MRRRQAAFKGCAAGNGLNDIIGLPVGTLSTGTTVSIGRSVQIFGRGIGTTTFQSTSIHGLFIESQTGGPARVSINDMTIRGNTQSQQVTGLFIAGTGDLGDDEALEVFLNRVRVADCTNTGILAQDEAYVEIRGSTIENNANSGMAFVSRASSCTRVSSTPTRVPARSAVGLISWDRGTANVDSTITSNRARRGGGLHVAPVNGGYLNLHNVTVSHNEATEQGGGVYDTTTEGTPLRTYDSIVAQNTAPLGPDVRGFVELNRTVSGAGAGVGPLLHISRRAAFAPCSRAVRPSTCSNPPRAAPSTIAATSAVLPVRTTRARMSAPKDGPQEAELLFVAAQTGSVNNVPTTSGPLSNNAGMHFVGNAAGQFVTYRVGVPQTGNYQLRMQIRKASSRAIWQLAVASSLNGQYTNIAAPQDHYNSFATTEELILGTVNATSAGEKFFRFTSTGKNAASTHFHMVIDYVWLIKL